eukprot:CAMPEP_0172604126 /NCGR_PEP_ID=MMETSP1068-20121228/24378_1 /TAXON_ID=35684 /ORGANISM="Pseudopedinella elastica, Strain CCMP716" /LENGTH=46 /DNA_ID= /DNA_START= /DNA_END= /DNA_ORIENTATION=
MANIDAEGPELSPVSEQPSRHVVTRCVAGLFLDRILTSGDNREMTK